VKKVVTRLLKNTRKMSEETFQVLFYIFFFLAIN